MGEVLSCAELIHGTDTLLGGCLLNFDEAATQELLSTVRFRVENLTFLITFFILPKLADIVVIELLFAHTVFIGNWRPVELLHPIQLLV